MGWVCWVVCGSVCGSHKPCGEWRVEREWYRFVKCLRMGEQSEYKPVHIARIDVGIKIKSAH